MLHELVVQTVLLYGVKIWVVMVEMLKVLEGLHHRLVRRIVGTKDRRMAEGEWEWPPVADALYIAVIWTLKEYIQKQKATIAAKTFFQTIYDICTGTEKIPGSSIFMRCWDQDVGQEVE